MIKYLKTLTYIGLIEENFSVWDFPFGVEPILGEEIEEYLKLVPKNGRIFRTETKYSPRSNKLDEEFKLI